MIFGLFTEDKYQELYGLIIKNDIWFIYKRKISKVVLINNEKRIFGLFTKEEYQKLY